MLFALAKTNLFLRLEVTKHKHAPKSQQIAATARPVTKTHTHKPSRFTGNNSFVENYCAKNVNKLLRTQAVITRCVRRARGVSKIKEPREGELARVFGVAFLL